MDVPSAEAPASAGMTGVLQWSLSGDEIDGYVRDNSGGGCTNHADQPTQHPRFELGLASLEVRKTTVHLASQLSEVGLGCEVFETTFQST